MIYENNPWKLVPFNYIKNEELADSIYKEGIKVVDFLSLSQLEDLRELYQRTHQIDDKSGGLFYGVYSQDLSYRELIQEKVSAILQPSLEKYFLDYKVMVNTFVVKVSGPKSQFFIHQDHTSLDEFKYSSLSIWIPLQDIDETNGAMCVVRKSHHFFSPYRGISFAPVFANIQSTIRKYLEPVFLKAGQAIFFDNRLLHHSLPNNSGANRAVLVSGIFPKEAKLIQCHKASLDSEIELIEQDDNFLRIYLKFNEGCTDRPHLGESLGFVKDEYPQITIEQFEQLCVINGIEPANYLTEDVEFDCNMIMEPLHKQ